MSKFIVNSSLPSYKQKGSFRTNTHTHTYKVVTSFLINIYWFEVTNS